MQCKICGSPTNATGEYCDTCMLTEGAVVFNSPTTEPITEIDGVDDTPQQKEPMDNDKYDTFIKKFNNGVYIKTTINYTKAVTEVSIYEGEHLMNNDIFHTEEDCQKALDILINAILEKERKQEKELEAKEEYFKKMKSLVEDRFKFEQVEEK